MFIEIGPKRLKRRPLGSLWVAMRHGVFGSIRRCLCGILVRRRPSFGVGSAGCLVPAPKINYSAYFKDHPEQPNTREINEILSLPGSLLWLGSFLQPRATGPRTSEAAPHLPPGPVRPRDPLLSGRLRLTARPRLAAGPRFVRLAPIGRWAPLSCRALVFPPGPAYPPGPV